MPISTYITEEEIKVYYTNLDDTELKELLDEVNSLDDGWSIHKKTYINYRFFRKPTIYYKYSLYYKIVATEYQIINFSPVGECSINTLVRREDVLNFLMGYLGGYSRFTTSAIQEVLDKIKKSLDSIEHEKLEPSQQIDFPRKGNTIA